MNEVSAANCPSLSGVPTNRRMDLSATYKSRTSNSSASPSVIGSGISSPGRIRWPHPIVGNPATSKYRVAWNPSHLAINDRPSLEIDRWRIVVLGAPLACEADPRIVLILCPRMPLASRRGEKKAAEPRGESHFFPSILASDRWPNQKPTMVAKRAMSDSVHAFWKATSQLTPTAERTIPSFTTAYMAKKA